MDTGFPQPYKARVLVTGAGGFIGHHLSKYLIERGYWVRGVDLKEPEYEATHAHEFSLLDLRRWEHTLEATESIDEVYNLAADPAELNNLYTTEAARAGQLDKELDHLFAESHRLSVAARQKKTTSEAAIAEKWPRRVAGLFHSRDRTLEEQPL